MLVDFYGVEPAFPLATHLITRSLEAAFPKRLYYVSTPSTSLELASCCMSVAVVLGMFSSAWRRRRVCVR
jgi:hypothetical protein